MVFIALRSFNYICDQFLITFVVNYSQIRCIALRVLQTSKEFSGLSVPSIILADILGNKCLLVIDAFPSTLFVSLFQGSLLVIALFRIVSGSDRLVFSVTYAAIYFRPPCWCLSEV